MTASPDLVRELKAQVLLLEQDLRARVEGQPDVLTRWQNEHLRATEANRTATSWVAWRDDRVTQAAVAWILTTVFIRFCEDNALLNPVWIAGPPQRRQQALDAQLAYFRTHPTDTDREWLVKAIGHLAATPATKSLVESHSLLWAVSPSGQAVMKLLDFWRERGEDGALRRDFTDPELSTRFLGDLYQDLSEHAKKTYALLQTPEFVEEFILDQTMEPALKERPIEGFKLIDPACGSGHFLLGAFRRLLDRWERYAPALEPRVRVQYALGAVHGVDLNPAAVAITRFRLTVAALTACSERSLEHAPAFALHVEAGDSLLFGHAQEEIGIGDTIAVAGFSYSSENREILNGLLTVGQYDVVVGNPPYITVKDQALRKKYRSLYPTCKGKYALTVPFMELFYELAKPTRGDQPAGWTGQITSGSFMKREFGSKIVEDFLVTKDLVRVIDSEGAWIPGHNMDGTPTVILIGRQQPPSSTKVRAVLGKGVRETRASGTNGQGPYWQSIIHHLSEPGYDDRWVTVMDLRRESLATHPWSLVGGGANAVLARIRDHAAVQARSKAKRIGFMAISAADEAFTYPAQLVVRRDLPRELFPPYVGGGQVRDFRTSSGGRVWFPYKSGVQLHLDERSMAGRLLWAARTELAERATFTGTYRSDGRSWWAWHQVPLDSDAAPLAVAFAEVATHNHFVLDRGGNIFAQTAPVIKLPAEASEEDHLALLGVLNSSVVCFWLKLTCKQKGGAADITWLRTYQFNSTNVGQVPLPTQIDARRGAVLDHLAQTLEAHSANAICAVGIPTSSALNMAEMASASIRGRMIAHQEELDWETYLSYGLLDEDLTYSADDLPQLALGERAFEIALARKVADGEEEAGWFTRHGSAPITEIPDHWPAGYRGLVQRRLDLIASDPFVGLLERPEYKRPWATEPWSDRRKLALQEWLLDRLEDRAFWFDRQGRPTPQSIGQLADRVARDADLLSVIALWEGRPDVPLIDSLTRLLTDEAVPYLAVYRLKESGMRKREAWEETWALQRREDAGEQVGTIPVPPKYTSADFHKPFGKQSWWQARGELDIPKERFILYANAGRSTDPTLLLGWAGWDHAQQALALATIISARESEGAADAVLVPLVAGLAELLPWVEQWHSEVDPAYGMSMATFFRGQLATRAQQVNQSLDQLRQWRPAVKARGRKAR